MSIVGGLDIHRQQITFDYVDTATGEVRRGQVCPADREHLAKWLGRFAGQDEVHLAIEGCTGWRYVAEEIAAAGFTAHLADPAEMAGLRGPKRRAKSDRADARHARVLLEQGRLPECWIPPSLILEYRALLELYADLREERTAWVQRSHAVLFHHGAPHIGGTRLGTAAGVAALRAAARACFPAGQLQVTVALESLEQADRRLHQVRRQLLEAARHLAGARELHARLYGVGPVTALALTCWLAGKGRFSSARKAVRFAGLGVTVYSSAGKGPPGRLSRQGPPVLRQPGHQLVAGQHPGQQVFLGDQPPARIADRGEVHPRVVLAELHRQPVDVTEAPDVIVEDRPASAGPQPPSRLGAQVGAGERRRGIPGGGRGDAGGHEVSSSARSGSSLSWSPTSAARATSSCGG